MVETQGRGTLHIHFLIWLSNCPPNAAAVERLLQSPHGERFQEQVASYAQRIVTNDLPIAVEQCGCSQCGAPFSELVGVQISDSARKDPIAGKQTSRVKRRVREPALIRCGSCGFEFSSQHLLRNALLHFGPAQWPLWERSLSPEEVNKQAATEAVCRDTLAKAVDIIYDRENIFASCKGEIGVASFSPELLCQQYCGQMPLQKMNEDAFKSDELARLFEVSPPSGFDERTSQSDVDYMVSTLAVNLNQHLWNHTNSCFKQSRSTTHDSYCRFRFPRETVPCTMFDSSGITLRRKLGHEFINAFNYGIMAAFRGNHDIQILLGGNDATDRIYYCCKYVTKYQKQLDSQVAIAVAVLKRRQECEQNEASESGGQGRRVVARKRVAALIYNLTNRQEIAGPLATLYLYRGSCCYSSASCTSLPLGEAIRQLTTEQYACALVTDDDPSSPKYHAVSFLDDYIYRPDKLQVEVYRTAKLNFRESHPLYKYHCLGKRHIDVVPVIQGFRVPSSKNDNSNLAWKRAVLSLILFKPFRSLADLIGESVDCADAMVWQSALDIWLPTRSAFVETIMENMQDYYNGQQRAEAESAAHAEAAVINHRQGDVESDVDGSNDSDELYGDDAVDPDYMLNDDTDVDEDMMNIWENSGDDLVVLDSSSLNPALCPTSLNPDAKTATILSTFRKYRMLDQAAEALANNVPAVVNSGDLPSIDTMKKWFKDSGTDNGFVHRDDTSVNWTRDTQVTEILSECLLDLNMEWRPSSRLVRDPRLKKRFANIPVVSAAYTLNERQHYAFKAIGEAVLSRWRQAEMKYCSGTELETNLRDGQLLFFLGGAGGTGKSRVIDSVQALVDSWGRPGCLVKTALTGKAATLIKGRTLASFLLQIRNQRASEFLTDLEILIIDEISMMKKHQLSQLDMRLRVAKRVPGVVFGGVHVVLAGDFLQLPPVGGTPLYYDPSQKSKFTPDELSGYQLWCLFTDCILLKESVRFERDPEWGRGCERARLGVWTPEFVKIINSRVVKSEGSEVEFTERRTSTFVTPDNSTRVAINRLFLSTAASSMPDPEYPVRIIVNFRGQLKGLNRSEVEMVMELPDTKFGRMAPFLDLIPGMPIQVTQNIRAEKMVANGTLGTLEAIIYHPGTTFCLVHDSVAGMTVKVPSIQPPIALVKIDRGASATAMRGCSDANIFPLFFYSQAYSSCDISLPGNINGIPRALSVKIQQFPLVCAVASTVYKVQGETLESMVVTEWRSQNTAANKKEEPYLMVSRVISRDAFTALEPLTDDIIAWARPSQRALDEEARLEQLCGLTLAKLSTSLTLLNEEV